MNILITGGAGFIGSHLAKFYLDKEYEVYVLDNLSSGYRENIPYIDNNHFFNIDICDYEAVRNIIKNYKFEIIIHLAAVVSVVETVNKPLISNEVNISATVNLLETNRIYNTNLKKFIFASSAAVYGNEPNLPKTTKSMIQPESPYAIQKYSGEQYTKM
ncbi:NAD-dependent dehydratase, partial [Staphylococcus xylosus]